MPPPSAVQAAKLLLLPVHGLPMFEWMTSFLAYTDLLVVDTELLYD